MTSYDPNVAPDTERWRTLDESEAISLVQRYHRSSRCEHPRASNPRVHAVIHVIVENQAAMEEVPVAATIARLMTEGLSRHDAVHAVGSVLAAGLPDLLKEDGDAEHFAASYHEELCGLTAESWLQRGGEHPDYGDVDDELEGGEEEHNHLHECGDPHCGHEAVPFRRESPKVGRNDPCPCGSGKKYKKCCLGNDPAG